MTNWIETHRGAVPPWQCDVTEHFTIAYYFDRIEEADANLADALGIGDLAHRLDIDRCINARFERELRTGASFHVDSAALSLDDGLRVGHRFVDSANGEVVSWFEVNWDLSAAPLTPQQRGAIEQQFSGWGGPVAEHRPEPTTFASFTPTARGRVKPHDLDAVGRFSLSGIVHRFSNSSAQLGAAIGMNAELMHKQRRGFSTFELILRTKTPLPLDANYLVETGIAHLGNTSLRMIHRMTNPRTGEEVARLSQYGVNLDLDARRPARWPNDVRASAEALLVPTG
jgi:acyl-CoA thioesterase FadM